MVDKIRARAVERQAMRVEDDVRKVIEDLRHGNIHEVLAKTKIAKGEIHKFFSDQWRQWQSQIIQNYETYASQSSIQEPMEAEFNSSNPDNAFTEAESAMLLEGLLGASKASVTKSAGKSEGLAEGDEAPPLTAAELEQMAEATLDEWEGFMGELWSQVLDAQMVKDYEARMSEIKQEVERLITLAKEGKIGPEFVLIALAKVNLTKNGVLFAWLGKKAFGINEQMSRAAEELQGMSPTDPSYFGSLQRVQASTREGGFQLNILTGDMQKVMQDVSSTLESVHGMMSVINQTRREMISKLAAR
jgi:ribosomal protein L17